MYVRKGKLFALMNLSVLTDKYLRLLLMNLSASTSDVMFKYGQAMVMESHFRDPIYCYEFPCFRAFKRKKKSGYLIMSAELHVFCRAHGCYEKWSSFFETAIEAPFYLVVIHSEIF